MEENPPQKTPEQKAIEFSFKDSYNNYNQLQRYTPSTPIKSKNPNYRNYCDDIMECDSYNGSTPRSPKSSNKRSSYNSHSLSIQKTPPKKVKNSSQKIKKSCLNFINLKTLSIEISHFNYLKCSHYLITLEAILKIIDLDLPFLNLINIKHLIIFIPYHKINHGNFMHTWTTLQKIKLRIPFFKVILELRIDAISTSKILDQFQSENVFGFEILGLQFQIKKSGKLGLSDKNILRSIISFFEYGYRLILKTSNFGKEIEKFNFLRALKKSILSRQSTIHHHKIDRFDIPQKIKSPYTINMSSEEYSICEADKIKYYAYQKAMDSVLSTKNSKKSELVIGLIGVGKGQMLRVLCQVLLDQKISPKRIICFEKNLSCRGSLLNLIEKDVNIGKFVHEIHLVFEDCRKVSLSDLKFLKINFLVFDMMGSLGCNELIVETLMDMLQ